MRKRQISALVLPLDREAQEALNSWHVEHRAQFNGLVLRFGKLHAAINAQKTSVGADAMKQALAQWEDDMLNTYLDLVQTLVPRLQDGYGGESTVTAFHTAIGAYAGHVENYRRLRTEFARFLDE